ncbi:helix-turn-helix domain-containing protein [Actinokineospora globicatena]|uniref:helix-turn-helix domain-containing protein n=1 Tax=Actinokineospora globicatena TaxID=103729 RepID=UPI00255742DD|nr:helix-turn-helix domain-containing protein [Actinokineospora globicatena]MCP2304082.1 DNA binding domain-containing protein, excisionase family [Actinokineospora globicatena]
MHTWGEDAGPLLFTPTQAADLLQVKESWLRRRAGQRRVPSTALGKHLRFSRADLERIAADAARPATGPGTSTRPTRSRPGSRRGTRPRGEHS